MTCKVSFFNSIRQNLKHHIASTFASILVFFIQFLIFFLNVQNIANSGAYSDISQRNYVHEDLLSLTEPNYFYYVPVLIVAVILAFDYFRYLHSKKQMDFYESLPVKRTQWFIQKATASFLVFFVPYLICTIFECIILFVYQFHDASYFMNLFWNAICMILIFIITWMTGVLAMVMTGHPVIASFGFAVFCGYAPLILRFIFPLYAEEYFRTYTSADMSLYNLTYISPIGLAVNLIGDSYDNWIYEDHTKTFTILILMILLVTAITYYLFKKRPSEAAGRAMAFEKINPVIRIAIVIPLSLYLGMYLSLVTNVGNRIWMVIGFILGVILLHGIIESIFQFDIRGLWSHKLQMVLCFAATLAIAFTFWIDLFGYDRYLPDVEELNSIKLNINDPYHHRYNDVDGLHNEEMELAYELLEKVTEHPYSSEYTTSMRVTYILKNGNETSRRYFINTDDYEDLIDKLYITKDYKNDICELYSLNRSNVVSIEWYDSVTSYPLVLTESEIDTLFDTFLAEFTPLTYTEMQENSPVGSMQIGYTNEYGYQDAFHCYIFPSFDQSITLLEEYLKKMPLTKDYGAITTPLLERYSITSLDIYKHEGEPFYTKDPELIEELKEHLILADDYYQKYQGYNSDEYYDGTAEVLTYDGRNYVSILIPIDILKPYLQ